MHRTLVIALSSTLLLHIAPLTAAPAARQGKGVAVQERAGTGSINGIAESAAGRPLPNHKVQVRDLQTGQLAGTGTSNAEGAFSIPDLRPAQYVVELLRNTGGIAGINAAMPVVAGGTVKMTVSATAAPATARAESAGIITTATAVTKAAVAADIAGVTSPAVGRDNASPSR